MLSQIQTKLVKEFIGLKITMNVVITFAQL